MLHLSLWFFLFLWANIRLLWKSKLNCKCALFRQRTVLIWEVNVSTYVAFVISISKLLQLAIIQLSLKTMWNGLSSVQIIIRSVIILTRVRLIVNVLDFKIAQSARNILYIRKSILGVRLFDCMKQVNFSGFKFWTLLFHTEITGTQMLLWYGERHFT